jgi:hypothetical protein
LGRSASDRSDDYDTLSGIGAHLATHAGPRVYVLPVGDKHVLEIIVVRCFRIADKCTSTTPHGHRAASWDLASDVAQPHVMSLSRT